MSATKVCPKCGDEYDESTGFCATDGTRLVALGQAGSDLVGTVVADRYRIVARLGEGGMGQVYLAEHVQMKRKSAIKIMRPALVGDIDALQRFTREAENASQISHPNVASIYDFGQTTDNLVYLAMEYIDGESFGSKLQREMAVHPDVAADILGQAADALQAAHDMGILHRDLKPDNIMLGRRSDGTYMVKLVDFGIARTMERSDQQLTQTGFAVGTPEYMSPEQLAGDKLDARSDLYSLALVAFAALTGKDAFPAEQSKESLIARLTSRPRTLQDAKEDVKWPEALQQIFDKALSPEASDRFDTVREFAELMSSAISVMTPSQTAAIYRRALEQRLASVAMLTPRSDLTSIKTPIKPHAAIEEGTGETAQEISAVPGQADAPAADNSEEPVGTGQPRAATSQAAATTREKERTKSRQLQWSARAAIVGVVSFVAGIGAWAMLQSSTVASSEASDSLSVDGASLQADSAQLVAMQAGTESGTDNARTITIDSAILAAIADSIRFAERDKARRDSVARVDRARRDSIASRAAAAARFPEAAIVAGITVAPNWRERSARGSDLRVAVLTPPVLAWRAEEARKWKARHVRSDSALPYLVVDPLELWSGWQALVAQSRPVVLIAVLPERAPFERIEPEKVTDFRRGDVQSVQLFRDGVPVPLVDAERFHSVVNHEFHAGAGKPVPFSFAATASPDAFAPRPDGKWPEMEVVVIDAMNRGREAKLRLSQQVVVRVHEDFAPYRAALK